MQQEPSEKLTDEKALDQVSLKKDTFQIEDAFQDTENAEIKYKTMLWWHATTLMISETVSLGVLSLPSMFATIGINLGLFFVLFLGIVATYTGYVLGQFKLKYPFVNTMSDAAFVLWGPTARSITGVVQVIFLIFCMGSHVLTGGIVFNVVTEHATCTIIFTVITTIICISITLPRTLKFVSYYSVSSCISIVVAVYLIMIAVSAGKKPADITFGFPKGTSFFRALNSITNIIFAYGGHIVFFNIMSEMKNPKEYTKALYCLQVFDIFVYLSVVLIYVYVGNEEFKRLSYVTALSAASPLIRKIAYLISIPTVIVSGVINGHIAAKYIMVYLDNKYKNLLHSRNTRSTVIWVLICSALWFISWLIAELIPIYNDLLGLIGSLFISWFTYGTGGIFWLYLEKGKYFVSKKSTCLFIVNTLIVAGTTFVMFFGVYSNIRAAYENRTVKGVFSCSE
ncbi:uncharacterized protein T551_01652 [Pneumocystis jirovecii RU7]|uniref:Amino acid transporter transmembrane domain-containing protein n=1 Tax=Pneumocystis jirovecii (strain RU7) TaxID=1408657 RepID=A0A0W4ZRV7_PNEJ7|nr:uncharacterized protein T551_01652 [Pneumocystis jirovecii RU7]KTW31100.1 hypothetical protein T551_01652 [Pneumocystis jirovecii RU7]